MTSGPPWRGMRRAGVLGINGRNALYTLRCNPRRFYPLVDDKLATKRLCEAEGIPVPRLRVAARTDPTVRRLAHADLLLCQAIDCLERYLDDLAKGWP